MATPADRYATVADHGSADGTSGVEQGRKRLARCCQLDASNDARYDADEHGPDGYANDAHAAADGRLSGEQTRAVSNALTAFETFQWNPTGFCHHQHNMQEHD